MCELGALNRKTGRLDEIEDEMSAVLASYRSKKSVPIFNKEVQRLTMQSIQCALQEGKICWKVSSCRPVSIIIIYECWLVQGFIIDVRK